LRLRLRDVDFDHLQLRMWFGNPGDTILIYPPPSSPNFFF
jgi:hypothetical protein